MKTLNIFLVCVFSLPQIFAAPTEQEVIKEYREYIRNYGGKKVGDVAARNNLKEDSRARLVQYGDQGIDILIGQLSSPKPGIYKDEVIQFFIDSPKLNHGKILPAVRRVLDSEETDTLYPSTIVVGIAYLANHGDREDIPLIERFSSNPVPGVKEGVTSTIRALRIRLGDESVDSASSSPTQKANPNPKLTPQASESSLIEPDSKPAIPLWAIFIGGIVLIGVFVALVKRK